MSVAFKNLIRNYASSGCKNPKVKCSKPSKKAEKKITPTCIVGPSGVHPTVAGGYKLYRSIFFIVCLPTVGLCGYNVYSNYKEPDQPPFVRYEYMRIRHKKFPWCGGTDKSFFHNPHLNALPDGYEEEEDE